MAPELAVRSTAKLYQIAYAKRTRYALAKVPFIQEMVKRMERRDAAISRPGGVLSMRCG